MFNLIYRPESFTDIIGNKATVESLSNLLKKKNKPHAYLLSGPRGCGKTTIARIIGKELNCSEQDFIEINMSNNRGIDTARDIINRAYLKPFSGPVKIYLLDEVHKSTNDFQNALLKILEEPPTHVYFILCTTEPDRLIGTVKSRCTSFEVEKLGTKRIRQLLDDVIKKEKLKISDTVIDDIIKKSDGEPRRALITLEKISAVASEERQMSIIEAEEKEEKNIIDLCRVLLNPKSKWHDIRKILSQVNMEPESARRVILSYFTKVLLDGDNPRAALIIDSFKDNYYDSGKAGLVFSCYSLFL